jgi:hypothetical protein
VILGERDKRKIDSAHEQAAYMAMAQGKLLASSD